jgi:hypothetical protein
MASKLLEEIATNGQQFVNSNDDESRQKLIAAATSLVQVLENPGEQMARIGWGEPTRTAALRTAFELGLLKKLGPEPRSSRDLASGTKADPLLVGELCLEFGVLQI